ncbi:MAG: phosphodiester glycosidase family protein [Ardenticatenaceae bacterium]|nr:phosphodiester glycosidase family protein [Ardenticatenaceae bacterium]
MKKHTFAIIYAALLIAATVWSLLDTFVIADKIVVVDETAANTSIYVDLENEAATSSSSGSAQDEIVVSAAANSLVVEPASSATSDSDLVEDSDSSGDVPIITANSYQDANMQITIETIRAYDTDIYIADVIVSDIAYLKTALAQNTFGKNIKETTSAMAEEHEAILAINGDYYGFRNSGFVVRNGVLYRTTARSGSNDALVVMADGNFEIVNESNTDVQALYDAGALQVFSFGPGLIENGEITVTSSSEVSQSKSSNPRTAIGMIAPLHYIFVVSDGRTSQSAGLSLLELAQIMQQYGVTEAYNLDGGGSSTMVFNGQVVNNPTDGRSYGERKVSDIIYIGEHL